MEKKDPPVPPSHNASAGQASRRMTRLRFQLRRGRRRWGIPAPRFLEGRFRGNDVNERQETIHPVKCCFAARYADLTG